VTAGLRRPRVLCALEEIPDGQAKGFTLDGGDESLDIFVWRNGRRAFGYVNSCPHTGGPLDWTPDRFMSADGAHIQCATHGALFQPEDGACFAGPCAGDFLMPVAVTVDEAGRVLVSAPDALD